MTSSLYHQSSSTNPPIRKLAECRSVEKSKSSGNHLPSDAFHRMVQFIWKNVKIAQNCEKKTSKIPNLLTSMAFYQINIQSINYLAKFQFWVLYWECHNTIATANKSKSRNSMQLTAAAAAAANTNNSKWRMAFSGFKKDIFLFILVAEYHFQVSGISLLDLALPFAKSCTKFNSTKICKSDKKFCFHYFWSFVTSSPCSL